MFCRKKSKKFRLFRWLKKALMMKTDSKIEKIDFTSFVTIRNKKKTIEVTWGYPTLMKEKKDGYISCYIPGFQIYFSVTDKDQIAEKSQTITKLFFDHFFIHRRNKLKDFALEMHKRGFKAMNDAFTLKELSNNRAIDAKFKSTIQSTPIDFSDSDAISQESEMEVAI